MNKNSSASPKWKDETIPVQVKLSVLWIGVMFFYVYADIKAFLQTGYIEQVISGEIDGFVLNQASLLYAAILMSIPPVMAFLSLILKPAVNRVVNIVLGSLHILLAVALLFGSGIWSYYYWYSAFEIGFHVLIVLHAIKWPKA